MKQQIETAIRKAIASVPGLDSLPPVNQFEMVLSALDAVSNEIADKLADAEAKIEEEE